MTIHSVPLQAQLAVIDRLLVEERKNGGTRNDALRAIAADLRARLDRAPTVAVVELQRRINYVKQSKRETTTYSDGTLIALGQELIGRWPVVKLALERFESETST